nr:hypothetical protein [Alphaproteobacteria bacterium]
MKYTPKRLPPVLCRGTKHRRALTFSLLALAACGSDGASAGVTQITVQINDDAPTHRASQIGVGDVVITLSDFFTGATDYDSSAGTIVGGTLRVEAADLPGVDGYVLTLTASSAASSVEHLLTVNVVDLTIDTAPPAPLLLPSPTSSYEVSLDGLFSGGNGNNGSQDYTYTSFNNNTSFASGTLTVEDVLRTTVVTITAQDSDGDRASIALSLQLPPEENAQAIAAVTLAKAETTVIDLANYFDNATEYSASTGEVNGTMLTLSSEDVDPNSLYITVFGENAHNESSSRLVRVSAETIPLTVASHSNSSVTLDTDGAVFDFSALTELFSGGHLDTSYQVFLDGTLIEDFDIREDSNQDGTLDAIKTVAIPGLTNTSNLTVVATDGIGQTASVEALVFVPLTLEGVTANAGEKFVTVSFSGAIEQLDSVTAGGTLTISNLFEITSSTAKSGVLSQAAPQIVRTFITASSPEKRAEDAHTVTIELDRALVQDEDEGVVEGLQIAAAANVYDLQEGSYQLFSDGQVLFDAIAPNITAFQQTSDAAAQQITLSLFFDEQIDADSLSADVFAVQSLAGNTASAPTITGVSLEDGRSVFITVAVNPSDPEASVDVAYRVSLVNTDSKEGAVNALVGVDGNVLINQEFVLGNSTDGQSTIPIVVTLDEISATVAQTPVARSASAGSGGNYLFSVTIGFDDPIVSFADSIQLSTDLFDVVPSSLVDGVNPLVLRNAYVDAATRSNLVLVMEDTARALPASTSIAVKIAAGETLYDAQGLSVVSSNAETRSDGTDVLANVVFYPPVIRNTEEDSATFVQSGGNAQLMFVFGFDGAPPSDLSTMDEIASVFSVRRVSVGSIAQDATEADELITDPQYNATFSSDGTRVTLQITPEDGVDALYAAYIRPDALFTSKYNADDVFALPDDQVGSENGLQIVQADRLDPIIDGVSPISGQNTNSLMFTLIFSEDLQPLDGNGDPLLSASDLVVVNVGNTNVNPDIVISGVEPAFSTGSASYIVTLEAAEGSNGIEAMVRLQIASGTDLTDLVGNPLGASSSFVEGHNGIVTFTIDSVAAELDTAGVAALGAQLSASASRADISTIALTFDDAIAGAGHILPNNLFLLETDGAAPIDIMRIAVSDADEKVLHLVLDREITDGAERISLRAITGNHLVDAAGNAVYGDANTQLFDQVSAKLITESLERAPIVYDNVAEGGTGQSIVLVYTEALQTGLDKSYFSLSSSSTRISPITVDAVEYGETGDNNSQLTLHLSDLILTNETFNLTAAKGITDGDGQVVHAASGEVFSHISELFTTVAMRDSQNFDDPASSTIDAIDSTGGTIEVVLTFTGAAIDPDSVSSADFAFSRIGTTYDDSRVTGIDTTRSSVVLPGDTSATDVSLVTVSFHVPITELDDTRVTLALDGAFFRNIHGQPVDVSHVDDHIVRRDLLGPQAINATIEDATAPGGVGSNATNELHVTVTFDETFFETSGATYTLIPADFEAFNIATGALISAISVSDLTYALLGGEQSRYVLTVEGEDGSSIDQEFGLRINPTGNPATRMEYPTDEQGNTVPYQTLIALDEDDNRTILRLSIDTIDLRGNIAAVESGLGTATVTVVFDEPLQKLITENFVLLDSQTVVNDSYAVLPVADFVVVATTLADGSIASEDNTTFILTISAAEGKSYDQDLVIGIQNTINNTIYDDAFQPYNDTKLQEIVGPNAGNFAFDNEKATLILLDPIENSKTIILYFDDAVVPSAVDSEDFLISSGLGSGWYVAGISDSTSTNVMLTLADSGDPTRLIQEEERLVIRVSPRFTLNDGEGLEVTNGGTNGTLYDDSAHVLGASYAARVGMTHPHQIEVTFSDAISSTSNSVVVSNADFLITAGFTGNPIPLASGEDPTFSADFTTVTLTLNEEVKGGELFSITRQNAPLLDNFGNTIIEYDPTPANNTPFFEQWVSIVGMSISAAEAQQNALFITFDGTIPAPQVSPSAKDINSDGSDFTLTVEVDGVSTNATIVGVGRESSENDALPQGNVLVLNIDEAYALTPDSRLSLNLKANIGLYDVTGNIIIPVSTSPTEILDTLPASVQGISHSGNVVVVTLDDALAPEIVDGAGLYFDLLGGKTDNLRITGSEGRQVGINYLLSLTVDAIGPDDTTPGNAMFALGERIDLFLREGVTLRDDEGFVVLPNSADPDDAYLEAGLAHFESFQSFFPSNALPTIVLAFDRNLATNALGGGVYYDDFVVQSNFSDSVRIASASAGSIDGITGDFSDLTLTLNDDSGNYRRQPNEKFSLAIAPEMVITDSTDNRVLFGDAIDAADGVLFDQLIRFTTWSLDAEMRNVITLTFDNDLYASVGQADVLSFDASGIDILGGFRDDWHIESASIAAHLGNEVLLTVDAGDAETGGDDVSLGQGEFLRISVRAGEHVRDPSGQIILSGLLDGADSAVTLIDTFNRIEQSNYAKLGTPLQRELTITFQDFVTEGGTTFDTAAFEVAGGISENVTIQSVSTSTSGRHLRVVVANEGGENNRLAIGEDFDLRIAPGYEFLDAAGNRLLKGGDALIEDRQSLLSVSAIAATSGVTPLPNRLELVYSKGVYDGLNVQLDPQSIQVFSNDVSHQWTLD